MKWKTGNKNTVHFPVDIVSSLMLLWWETGKEDISGTQVPVSEFIALIDTEFLKTCDLSPMAEIDNSDLKQF